MKRRLRQRVLSMLLVLSMTMSFIAAMSGAGLISADGFSDSSNEAGWICGMEEHIHDGACYEAVAGDARVLCREQFERDGLFYWDEMNDPYREAVMQRVVHEEHNVFCYDSDGNLTCYLSVVAEHLHDDGCYDVDGLLFCEVEETLDWPVHVHSADCYEQAFDDVLVCGLTEHIHTADCERSVTSDDEVSPGEETGEQPGDDVPSGEEGGKQPDDSGKFAILQSFYDQVDLIFRAFESGRYEQALSRFEEDYAIALELYQQLFDFVLTESEQASVDDCVRTMETICQALSEQDVVVDTSPVDNFEALVDAFVTAYSEPVYTVDRRDFQQACVDIEVAHVSLLDMAFDDELMERIADALSLYQACKVDFETRMDAEVRLAAFIGAVDKLIQNVDAGVYEDDMDAFKAACEEADKLLTDLDSLVFDDAQKERLDTAAEQFEQLKALLSANPVEMSVVATLKVGSQVIASDGMDYFFYRFTEAVHSDDVVMPDSNVVYAPGESVVSLDVSITMPGVYTFNIVTENSRRDYRLDERTWQAVVTVELDEDNLVVSDIKYQLVGFDDARTDYAEFIQVCTNVPGWRASDVEKAMNLMSMMSLEDKVGQLILMHYPERGAGTTDAAKLLIDKYRLGGFLTFAPMYGAVTSSGGATGSGYGAAVVRNKIVTTQSYSKIPMLFTVDEEGGSVCRISCYPSFRSSRFPAPRDLGTLSGVVSNTNEIADLLLGLGVNVNHAPVGDVSDVVGSFVYKRTFGTTGIENADYVETYIRASNARKLGSTMKHFPGYGSTSDDTHVGFAVNPLPKSGFWYNDLLPFYAGVAAGGRSVMVTHNIVNAFDTENPASLSPAIYRLLRDELGFDGVAMTDDLNMGAITQFLAPMGGSKMAGLVALQAGADMAMIDSEAMADEIFAAATDGRLSESEIDEKCLRVLCWKAELGLLDNIEFKPEDCEAMYTSRDGEDVTYGSYVGMMTKAANNGGTVSLLRDVEAMAKSFTIGTKVTLDLNGFDLTYRKPMFDVVSSGTLVVTDSVGTIVDSASVWSTELREWRDEYKYLYYNYRTVSNGEVNRYASFSGASKIIANTGSGDGNFVRVNGGSFILDGCLLDGENAVTGAILSDVNANNSVTIKNGGIVNYGSSRSGGGTTACVEVHGGHFSMSGGYIMNFKTVGTSNAHGAIALLDGCSGSITGGVVAYNAGGVSGGGLFSDGGSVRISNAVFTGNWSSETGGNIAVLNAKCTLAGDSNVSYGSSKNGAGIYLYGDAASLELSGKSFVFNNIASGYGGGVYASSETGKISKISMFDRSFVEGNTARFLGAGFYANTDSFVFWGEPAVYNNVANHEANNIYLFEGQILTFPSDHTGAMAPATLIYVYTESEASRIPVCVSTHSVIVDTDVMHFASDRLGYTPILNGDTVVFVGSDVIDIPVFTALDGEEYQIGHFTSVWRDKDGHPYVNLMELSSFYNDFSFDIGKYEGSPVLAVQAGDSDMLELATLKPFLNSSKIWCSYLPDDIDFENSRLFFLPNSCDLTEISYADVLRANSYYSVSVVDVYGTETEDVRDESFRVYIPAGSSMEFMLPVRTASFEWVVNEHEDSDFLYNTYVSGTVFHIQLSNVYKPVEITSGDGNNSRFTVQYYAQITRLQRFETKVAGSLLTLIDTSNRSGIHDGSGGVLPTKGTCAEANIKPVYLLVNDANDGSLRSESKMISLYQDRGFVYSDAPSLLQVDRLNTNEHFSLEELWVLKPGKNPISTNAADFDVYNKTALGLSSIHDLQLTNSKDYAVPNAVIYVGDGSVIRFVYKESTALSDVPVSFYDYDITNGFIYAPGDTSYRTKYATSEQDGRFAGQNVVVDTTKEGINAPTGKLGIKFGFGNLNMGLTDRNNGEGDVMFCGGRLNGYRTGSFLGCTFGIVERALDSKGQLVFSQDPAQANPMIRVPSLFNEASGVTGKTAIPGYNLEFSRTGDVYTLQSVSNASGHTVLRNLDKVEHPVFNGQSYNHIWTNNFWPADSFSTYGANGHDAKFGGEHTLYVPSKNGKDKNLSPDSDDGLDHNSYFGMHFTVDFHVEEGYKGDLECWFFGDDDMWVFLDGQQVLDIGGIHSSVGEYVNLRDYVVDGDTSTHRLSFFYLERGASGSTCWMQFTLPNAHFEQAALPHPSGGLKFSKTVSGLSPYDSYDFDVTVLDNSGHPVSEDLEYVTYDMSGEPATMGVLSGGSGVITLVGGQTAMFPYLSAGYQFEITEQKCGRANTTILFEDAAIDGMTVSGIIEDGVVSQAEFINDYGDHPALPNTGGDGRAVLFTGIGATALVGIVLFYAVYDGKKRRSRSVR